MMRVTKRKVCVSFAMLLLTLASAAIGRTIYVDNDGPADFNNIQAAIDDSNDVDTIIVADGTYRGWGNRDIDFKEKDVTLRSENGPETCIIDCNGSSTNKHCAFYINSVEDQNSIIDGFTIINGYAMGAGGIFCERSSLTITNCIFRNNTGIGFSDGGGGINSLDSNLILINSTFSNNSGSNGGGLSCYEGESTVINCNFIHNKGGGINYRGNRNILCGNCTFIDNSNAYGAGIQFESCYGSAKVINCSFINNTASEDGGGIHCWDSSPTIMNCTFCTNSAEDDGGGISLISSSPSISDCTFSGNSANSQFSSGGGMYIDGQSSPIISNCTFFENLVTQLSSKGGGIFNEGNLTLLNCTFSLNSASDRGGGIFLISGSPTISDCTFIGNSAYMAGGGMCIYGQSSPRITNCTFSGNLVTRLSAKGGGIFNEGNSILTNCTFSLNSATNPKGCFGGGMYNIGSPILINCSFVANKGGGAIRNVGDVRNLYECTPTFINCSITSNWDGITNVDCIPTITNCILWGNHYKTNATLLTQLLNANSYPIINYCCIQGWTTDSGGTGNINIDPCFVSPGYWADANEPNIIVEPNDPNAIWINGDYHLKSQAGHWDANSLSWVKDDVTSLCIDAGDPNSDWTKELWPNGKRINMGAYGGTPQASMSLNNIGNIADLNLDGFRYFADLELLSYKWLNEELFLPEDLDRNGFVDFFDFAIFGANWERPPLPGLATNPNPPDGATAVILTPKLSWTAGSNTLWHDVYFGTSSPGSFIGRQNITTFEPGALNLGTWYYWRIDEINPGGSTEGTVWRFRTGLPPEPANNPSPPDGSIDINPFITVLGWTPGDGAVSHDVYFGTDSPGTFRRNQTTVTFNPGFMNYSNTYYWRIDEINDFGKTTGEVWSFTTSGKTVCFPADTLVWINGAPVQISTVNPNQNVGRFYSTMPISSSKEIEKVEEHIGAFSCYDVILENAESISVADNHYFLLDSGRWVSLKELTGGLKLQSLNGPIAVKCVVKRAMPFVGKVYNLKIKDSDRYFVGSDAIIVRDY